MGSANENNRTFVDFGDVEGTSRADFAEENLCDNTPEEHCDIKGEFGLHSSWQLGPFFYRGHDDDGRDQGR